MQTISYLDIWRNLSVYRLTMELDWSWFGYRRNVQ